MKMHNWLYNYRYAWAIEKSFGGLVKRAAYLTESEIAFGIFNKHYHDMQVCYQAFFPEVKKLAANFLKYNPAANF